jgi:flagellar motor protein MotB
MVTFSDLMCLLMCLFVIIMSMGEPKKKKAEEVAQSIRSAFGSHESSFPFPGDSRQMPSAAIERLMIKYPQGGAISQSTPGRDFLTTSVREGLKVVIGGRFSFEEGSAELTSEAKEQLAVLARSVRGYGNWLDVRGHCSRNPEDIPEGAKGLEGKTALSWARAQVVARELEQLGIPARRLRIAAVADHDPMVEELTHDDEKTNRRIEMILSEDVIRELS